MEHVHGTLFLSELMGTFIFSENPAQNSIFLTPGRKDYLGHKNHNNLQDLSSRKGAKDAKITSGKKPITTCAFSETALIGE